MEGERKETQERERERERLVAVIEMVLCGQVGGQ